MFNAFKTSNFENWQKFSLYPLCRWLSGSEKYVLIANALNDIDIKPSKMLFEGTKQIMNGYIPYPKYQNKKVELTEEDRKEIEQYHLGVRDLYEI